MDAAEQGAGPASFGIAPCALDQASDGEEEFLVPKLQSSSHRSKQRRILVWRCEQFKLVKIGMAHY